MQFIRSYTNNISTDKDDYITKSDKTVDRLKPEVFDNVIKFVIHTDDGQHIFSDKDNIWKIIESFNYFTVIYDGHVKYWSIKSPQVRKIEFITF